MLKRMLSAVREYKKPALITPLLMSLEVAMECTIPLLTAQLIDQGITPGNMQNIMKWGLLLLLAAGLMLTFGCTAGRFSAIASIGFGRNLRHDMFANIQSFSFSNIDKFSAAGLVTRLTTDVTNVQSTFQTSLTMLFRAPVMFVVALFMSFQINPSLSLVFLVAIPILAIFVFLIIKKVFPIFQKAAKITDRLNERVQEDLEGIRVVKSFVREDYETKKFQEVSESLRDHNTRAEKTLMFGMPVMQMTLYLCTVLICWFGARIIILNGGGGDLTTGGLMSLLTYASQLLMSLMFVAMLIVMGVLAAASAKRVVEVLDEKADITDGEEGLTRLHDGSIVFDHVLFSYSGDTERLALKDVSVSIPSGATVGILGGTGSSKSTFVQMIPRLYDVTDGSVQVGGKDVRNYKLSSLRDQVAVVLQKNTLFSGTLRENLKWGNDEATDDELMEACQVAQAYPFIQELPNGFDTMVEQGGTNFSGGQRQRLCIARALLKKPKILILDDSTSAVDTKTDAFIRQGLRAMYPDTTKLIIAQRLSSVEDADMIIMLDEGRIQHVGTHQQLMEVSDVYRQVYTTQQKKGEEE